MNKERVEISVLCGSKGIGLTVNNYRVTDFKLYGMLSPMYTFNVEKSKILEALGIKSDSEKAHSKEKVGEWISVKDRLPEEYDNYMCTMSNGDVQECTFVPKNIKGLIAGWSTCDADGFMRLNEEDIIAWQPLPKPYKESEE